AKIENAESCLLDRVGLAVVGGCSILLAMAQGSSENSMRERLHFKLNEAQAVQEEFDGEALAINLDTGTYYSMPGTAAYVWRSLIKGIPLGAIARALSKACDATPETIAAQIDE